MERALGLLVLLVDGILSLTPAGWCGRLRSPPTPSTVRGSENWILPTEGGMAVIGAVGLMIPA